MPKKEITIFSTSFLDLLSCGMGAVILLCLIFAASKTATQRIRGETQFLTITVEGPTANGAAPLIRVWVDIDGNRVEPGMTENIPSRNARVSVQPAAAEAQSYQIIITGENFTTDDVISLQLVDLNGVHREHWKLPMPHAVEGLLISARQTGKNAALKAQKAVIPFTDPYRKASLNGLESPGFELKWKPVP